MKNKKSTITYLGLDVSKVKLDLSGTENSTIKHQIFENTSKGIKELIHFLRSLTTSLQIVLEPTGGYERLVIEALRKAQIVFSRVNAHQVRAFAIGLGWLAKTDKIDAFILAKFGECAQPKPSQFAEKAEEELRALYDRRQQLISIQTSECNRLETALPAMKSHLMESLCFINKQIKKIDLMIEKYFSKHPQTQEKIRRLQSVVGVGKQTATAFVVYMPELGKISHKAAAALVGVAPFNRDSGKTFKNRSIQRGRSQLRRVLYMAAVCASQRNHILKKFYARLKAQGKPAKLALVAVMRKLVMLLNHMMENPNFSLAH
ncbi:MAG: IS110 family transposase [Chthoniobacterales bacterium]